MVTDKDTELLKQEFMELVIKRSGCTKKDIIEGAMKRFFNNNMYLLTPEELQKYRSVIASRL